MSGEDEDEYFDVPSASMSLPSKHVIDEQFFDTSPSASASGDANKFDVFKESNEAIVDQLIRTSLNADTKVPLDKFDQLTSDANETDRSDKVDTATTSNNVDELMLQRIQAEDAMDDDEIEELYARAFEMKLFGNREFGNGEYIAATATYTRALDVCPVKRPRAQTDIGGDLRTVLYCNRAAALLKRGDYRPAIDDCTQALQLQPHCVKAMYRRAWSREQIEQEWDAAIEDYRRVVELDPPNVQARAALVRLPTMINERNERMKREMLDQLKQLGNTLLRPFGLSTDSFQLTPNADGGAGYSVKMNR